MKKIMFNDRYGLTQAVLDGKKTMTRRLMTMTLHRENGKDMDSVVPDDMFIATDGTAHFQIGGKDYIVPKKNQPAYHVGEEVAIAQAYQTIRCPANCWKTVTDRAAHSKGWTNKMFVKAWYMPHRIRITGIKVERLQDISEEDCVKEGIVPTTWRQWLEQDINDLSPQKYKDWDVWTLPKFIDGLSEPWKESDPDEYIAKEPRTAFAVLISKLMGRNTWERNPWVYAYEFKLLKYRD